VFVVAFVLRWLQGWSVPHLEGDGGADGRLETIQIVRGVLHVARGRGLVEL
jgi:hypothetical protein